MTRTLSLREVLTLHDKLPKHIEFSELPRTSTGKIQKFALRERANDSSS